MVFTATVASCLKIIVFLSLFFCAQVLQDVANVNVTIYFNCREKLSEMPLKR